VLSGDVILEHRVEQLEARVAILERLLSGNESAEERLEYLRRLAETLFPESGRPA
jgi:hypothetical protein